MVWVWGDEEVQKVLRANRLLEQRKALCAAKRRPVDAMQGKRRVLLSVRVWYPPDGSDVSNERAM
jgi:hypothetical protein